MQHIITPKNHSQQGRGGRISSPRLRETIIQSQDFVGLEESVKHFDLLTLVKRAGKGAGFTPKMIELLEHYMIFTREIDWEQGNQPIIYKSQYQTAMDLGISERHVQRLEKQLFDVGVLTWQDSGNHKRYGQRCAETGRILYAFGVDLTPLAYMKAQLENIVQEQQLYKAAWMETKRQISWYRSQIKSMLAEMNDRAVAGQGSFYASYEEVAVRFTTSMSLETLRNMLCKHKALYQDVLAALEASYAIIKQEKESCKTDSRVQHLQDTNQKSSNKLDTNRRASPNCFQKSSSQISEPNPDTSVQMDNQKKQSRGFSSQKLKESQEELILKTGLQHITGKQLLNAASPRFRDHIPLRNGPMNFDDIVDAAYALRSTLNISQGSWSRACQTLTRTGAAVCLLLVDQAAQREENRVMKPAAYFNTMISRAIVGDLHLHKSIFGLLKQGETPDSANSNKSQPDQWKG